MSWPLTALLLVMLLFSVYWWMSSLECSVSLVRLLPKYVEDPELANSRFTPLWEVTNVFLVFGFTGYAFLFSNAIVSVSKAVLPVVIVGVTALLIRASLVLYLFYHKAKMGFTIANLLFLLACFTVPLSFGSVGIFMLTGTNFWHSLVGVVAFAALAVGLIALSVSFIFKQSQNSAKNLKYTSVGLNITSCIVASIILINLLINRQPHLLNASFIYFALITGLTIIAQSLLLLAQKEKQMWWYLSFAALTTPLLLALANRPYFVYPTIYLDKAYGANSFGEAAIIGLAAVFPVIIIGLFLLYRLLPRSSRRVIK